MKQYAYDVALSDAEAVHRAIAPKAAPPPHVPRHLHWSPENAPPPQPHVRAGGRPVAPRR
jgi:hypothetical protein